MIILIGFPGRYGTSPSEPSFLTIQPEHRQEQLLPPSSAAIRQHVPSLCTQAWMQFLAGDETSLL